MSECKCASRSLVIFYRSLMTHYLDKCRLLRKQDERMRMEITESRAHSEEVKETLKGVAAEIRAAGITDIDPVLRQRILMPIRKMLNGAPPLTVVKD